MTCGIDGYSEKGYCTWACYRDSDKRKLSIEKVNNFLKLLDGEQLKLFKDIDDIYSEDEYLVLNNMH